MKWLVGKQKGKKGGKRSSIIVYNSKIIIKRSKKRRDDKYKNIAEIFHFKIKFTFSKFNDAQNTDVFPTK